MLSWACHKPVIFGDTLLKFTQLETLDLCLSDFTKVEHLPPHVTSLTLDAKEHLDMTMAPWLLCCSSLRSLYIQTNKGEHSHAPTLCA